jgi:hypothetical protein
LGVETEREWREGERVGGGKRKEGEGKRGERWGGNFELEKRGKGEGRIDPNCSKNTVCIMKFFPCTSF